MPASFEIVHSEPSGASLRDLLDRTRLDQVRFAKRLAMGMEEDPVDAKGPSVIWSMLTDGAQEEPLELASLKIAEDRDRRDL